MANPHTAIEDIDDAEEVRVKILSSDREVHAPLPALVNVAAGLPSPASADTFLVRNSGNTAYETQTANEVLTTLGAQTTGREVFTSATPTPARKRLATLDRVSTLEADTELAYSSGIVPVAAGDIVEADGFRYEVADSAEVDPDLTTAGGVKVFAQPILNGGRLNVAELGVKGDNSTDDTTAMQRALDVCVDRGVDLDCMPDSQILISSPLTCGAISINGRSSEIRATAVMDHIMLVDQIEFGGQRGGRTISGLSLQGGTGSTQTGHNATNGLVLRHAGRMRISEITVERCNEWGIRIEHEYQAPSTARSNNQARIVQPIVNWCGVAGIGMPTRSGDNNAITIVDPMCTNNDVGIWLRCEASRVEYGNCFSNTSANIRLGETGGNAADAIGNVIWHTWLESATIDIEFRRGVGNTVYQHVGNFGVAGADATNNVVILDSINDGAGRYQFKNYFDSVTGTEFTGLQTGGGAIEPISDSSREATHALVLRGYRNVGSTSQGGVQVGGDATDKVGFYGTTPIARPTGVAVDAAAIHAALVSLGLITS